MRAAWIGLLLVGCGEPEAAEEPATACAGAGDPSVAVGSGGLASFDAWTDGASAPVTGDPDALGLRLELLSEGLDTTASVSSVVRIDVDGTTADAIANLSLQCPSEGPGWVAVFAPLPSTAQGPDAASVAGLAAILDVTLTDASGETASQTLDLVLAGG
jgi:hypothetical protein